MIGIGGPLTILILTAISARYLTRSWLTPGAFFALLWSCFMLMPLLFAADFKVDTFGLWYITIFSMSCVTGSVIAFERNANNSFLFERGKKYTGIKILSLSFYSLILVAFCGLVLLVFFTVSNYSLSLNSKDILTIPNLIAIDRYADNIIYPAHIKFSLYCLYPAALLGGFIFSLDTPWGKNKVFSLLPIIAAIVLGVIEAARASILLALVLYFSALFTGTIFENKINKRNYFRYIIPGATFITVFIVFFITIQWLRQGMDPLIIELLVERIRSYFFGYLPAFTYWLGQDHLFIGPTLGLTTFAGPSNLMGMMERPLGFYIPVSIGPGITTNIFSALRGLIIDFSVLGSFVISFIAGFLSQLAFNRVRSGSWVAMVPLSMFYAFTLYSPLISIFHYNSVIVSWVFAFLIFSYMKYKNHEILAYYS